jgi:hypothetical protein
MLVQDLSSSFLEGIDYIHAAFTRSVWEKPEMDFACA